MRIAILHNRYRERGGEDAVVEQEVQLLREYGHEASLHVADNRSIEEAGSRIALAAGTIWSRTSARSVGRFLDGGRFDLVHVHNTFPLLSPSVLVSASRRGLPVVQTLHNFRLLCPAATFFRDGRVCTDCLGRGIPWPGVLHACYRNDRAASAVVGTMLTVHRALRTWHRQVDAFIALTRFARSQFVSGGLPPERVHVRPNFAPDPGDEAAAERLDRGGAVYAGRLSAEKGVIDLVRAWGDVDADLTVLGDGPLRSELERVAPARVRFRGRVERADVHHALKHAGFLVVPSICLESFPVVVLEAFSLGIPVLASDLGSLGEIVEDGVTGRLFPAGKPGALASAARELVADPASRERLGKAAREVFLACYAPQAAYESLLEVYRRAAERAAARHGSGDPVSG